MEHEKIDLEAKLAQFDEQWSPKLVGELNGQAVKLAKLEGEFVWHHHAEADELFLVLDGHLTIELPEESVDLDEGECLIVPRGVEHKPVADGEAEVLLFEPAETRNTGNVENERTAAPSRSDRCPSAGVSGGPIDVYSTRPSWSV